MALDSMIYPTIEFGDGRIIPCVRLPRNFKELVPKFYKQGRKENIFDYVAEFNSHLESCGINIKVNSVTDLIWDDEFGLTIIKMRPSGGLDLDYNGWPGFSEHNLGGKASFVAGAIAMKYVSELIKSAP